MIPARNAIEAHAQDFRANDQLLLSSLQAFAQCTGLLHSIGNDCCYLCTVAKLSVAPTNSTLVDCVRNVMAHAQKPDFVFRRNGWVHLNRRGRQFSRLLEADVCASAVVMLDTPSSEIVRRVLVTHSIRQFPLHFPTVRHRVPSHFNWTLPSRAAILKLFSSGDHFH